MPDLTGQSAIGNTRNLLFGSGDRGAALSVNRNLASNVAGSVPSVSQGGYSDLNSALQGLLQGAQGLGTAPFQNAVFNAQGQQAQAILSPNLQDLIGASPSQQQSVIQGQASQFSPVIQGAEQLGKTFSEQLGSFSDVIRGIQDFEKQKKTFAENQFKTLLTTLGGEGLMNWATTNPQEATILEKEIGLGRGSLGKIGTTLKEQDLAIKKEREAQTNLVREQASLVRQQRLQQLHQEEDDVKRNGQLLAQGLSVPSLMGGFGTKKNALIAEADRIMVKETGKHYNPVQEELKYTASKRFVTSLNSPQQVRFNLLATSVVNTIDEVRNLGEQVKNTGLTPLNKVKLQAYVNVFGNTEQGQLVAQYLAAANTLKEEFANLVNGGYAPTEAAFSLANRQVNENYGVDELRASLFEVQKLINYRLGAQGQISPQYGEFGDRGSLFKTKQGGTIRVKEKSSGRTGTIPFEEFDPNQYDKL